MIRRCVTIEAGRDAYCIGDVRTMTVGELIDELRCYDEDMPVIISNDHGYTYGGLSSDSLREKSYDDEE